VTYLLRQFVSSYLVRFSHHHLKAEARVHSHCSSRGICAGKKVLGTGFYRSTSVLPCQCHSINLPCTFISFF